MKRLTIFAALALALTSCTKQYDYLCKIETWDPRGFAPTPQVKVVNYHGTYSGMKAFEQANTWADSTNVPGDAPLGSWQTCRCK